MQQNLPRLILAGTNSGCGKTTVTCAVLQALVNRGLSVAAAKCGPDYIDPMFHSRIIGAKSSNLDPFFFDENTLRFLLAQNASGCDVTVIEGVMGYYDGLGLTSTRASTYELAQKTVSPVVLVVNARGAALSVLASVRGFLDFLPDDRICGVILNGCTAMTYAPLARVLEDRLGVKDTRPLADFLPTLTIAAKNLATEMTNYNVEEKDLQGERAITGEHVQNNLSVREMLGQRGIKPENLPPAEDIKKLERRVKSQEKKLAAQSGKLPEKGTDGGNDNGQ